MYKSQGYRYEQLAEGIPDPAARDLLDQTDVLVDGPFVQAQHSYQLPWRGSRNQRLIDVPATRARGRIVLWETHEDFPVTVSYTHLPRGAAAGIPPQTVESLLVFHVKRLYAHACSAAGVRPMLRLPSALVRAYGAGSRWHSVWFAQSASSVSREMRCV